MDEIRIDWTDADQLIHLIAGCAAAEEVLRPWVQGARDRGQLTDEPPLSLHAWRVSTAIADDDPPFAALIAAALRKADGGNAALIRGCWPHLAATAQARYDAPGGQIEGDR